MSAADWIPALSLALLFALPQDCLAQVAKRSALQSSAQHGHIIFRQGKRVVITDPKQINDPLSEALAAVATEVHKLRERVKTLEGSEEKGEPPAEPLQRIMDDLDYQI